MCALDDILPAGTCTVVVASPLQSKKLVISAVVPFSDPFFGGLVVVLRLSMSAKLSLAACAGFFAHVVQSFSSSLCMFPAG
jgi:hypothetical protein